MKFANIPPEILAMELKEFESDYTTLAKLLVENSDEEIEKATYTISQGDIRKFVAYTRNYILTLKFTALGHYLMKEKRTIEDLEFLNDQE